MSKRSHVNWDSCIAMHTNHLLIECLSYIISIKLFLVKIITVKQKPNPLLNASLLIHPLTMKRSDLLVPPGSPSVASTALL